MKKVKISLSAIALLIGIGAAFAFQSDANFTTTDAESQFQDTIFTLVPGHPNAPLSGSRSTIEPLCPGEDNTCATSNPSGSVIEWSGAANKF